jgi:hypothetical protein
MRERFTSDFEGLSSSPPSLGQAPPDLGGLAGRLSFLRTRVATFGVAMLGIGPLLSGGCLFGDLEESLQDALDDLEGIAVCGDMTLQELMTADEISDSCRDALESLLPPPEHNFDARLVALGSDVTDDGARRFYVHGATHGGAVLTADALAAAEVQVVVEGETTTLQPGDFSIRRVDAGDVIALSLVNDYSGSMLDGDLDAVALIHRDMFTYLPPVHETAVVQFSDEVDVRQPYTSDAGALLAAVERDDGYTRGSTALYDGMSIGLDGLVVRDRPIKILMVSTDGAENASTQSTKPELLSTIERHGVIVVMLGALLADVPEMRDLAGLRGVLFYTRYYSELREQMRAYLESLGEIVEVELDPAYGDASSVTLAVDGISTTWD